VTTGPVFLQFDHFYSNRRIIEVAVLVPVVCSYSYSSRSVIHKNISDFIYDILGLVLYKFYGKLY